MPTKVFKVEYMHHMFIENAWLGSNMHVGWCHTGMKIAFWHWTAAEP